MDVLNTTLQVLIFEDVADKEESLMMQRPWQATLLQQNFIATLIQMRLIKYYCTSFTIEDTLSWRVQLLGVRASDCDYYLKVS
jgi:hypothetical protein